MSTITEQFEAAQVAVKNLSEKPGNFDLLALYANFKQATDGDADGNRPGMTEFVLPGGASRSQDRGHRSAVSPCCRGRADQRAA